MEAASVRSRYRKRRKRIAGAAKAHLSLNRSKCSACYLADELYCGDKNALAEPAQLRTHAGRAQVDAPVVFRGKNLYYL